jgi:hypothetical protein
MVGYSMYLINRGQSFLIQHPREWCNSVGRQARMAGWHWLAWIVGGVLVETLGCTAGRTAVDGGNVSWTDFGCNGSMSALDAHDGPMVSEH